MFENWIDEVKEILNFLEGLEVSNIARRMFVTNAFDSIIATIGIIIGNYAAGASSSQLYLGTILGGSLAMSFFSRFIGVYVTERAERLREIKEIEKQLLSELRTSIYKRVLRIAPIYVAISSMLGSFLFPLLILTPFLLSSFNLLTIKEAVGLSLAIANIIIMVVGAYLGKISREGWVKGAIKFVAIGITATISLLLLTLIF